MRSPRGKNLSPETIRALKEYSAANPTASNKQLATRFDTTPATVRHHLPNLDKGRMGRRVPSKHLFYREDFE